MIVNLKKHDFESPADERMRAYDVHQHENVVFDSWGAVIGDHRLVDDDQRLDESLPADWPRSASPPWRPSFRRRRRPTSIWSPSVDDRSRPPFVLIVSGRGPDGSRSSVTNATARVRRVPATVVVCTRAEQRILIQHKLNIKLLYAEQRQRSRTVIKCSRSVSSDWWSIYQYTRTNSELH